MRRYSPRDVYSNIRNEFSQQCYLISGRGRYIWMYRYAVKYRQSPLCRKLSIARTRYESNAIANLLADNRRRSASARTRSCFYSSYIFFSTRLSSPLLFSSGPAVIIRYVTVIFFDVFIEFCVERAFRSEKCSFCVRPGEFTWPRRLTSIQMLCNFVYFKV